MTLTFPTTGAAATHAESRESFAYRAVGRGESRYPTQYATVVPVTRERRPRP
jgi:hypothetical protein